MKSLAWRWLSGKVVCIASDGWSNINRLPVVNYMAVSGDKALFIESVTKDNSHDAEWLSNDMTRVIGKLEHRGRNAPSVAGVVMDNTNTNKLMWANLSVKYPWMFVYGCASHALHLLVRDILFPSNLKENNAAYIKCRGSRAVNENLEAVYPASDWPFKYLLDHLQQSRDLVNFFHNNHF